MVSDSKSDVRKYRGFKSLLLRKAHAPDQAHHFHRSTLGGMTEWPKVHDWKSCVLKGTEGSNPSLSAILDPPALAAR